MAEITHFNIFLDDQQASMKFEKVLDIVRNVKYTDDFIAEQCIYIYEFSIEDREYVLKLLEFFHIKYFLEKDKYDSLRNYTLKISK